MSVTTATAGVGGGAAAAGTEAWLGRRWFTPSGALVAEAAAGVEPLAVFRHLAARPHCLFLDSALCDEPGAADARPVVRLGRYSFLTADPIHSLVVRPDRTDRAGVEAAFAGLRGMLADLRTETIPGLPPFQGGLAGLVSYDGGLALLGLESPAAAGPAVPWMSLHLYDVVFAWDHDLGRGWFISQGLPARGPVARGRRAEERLAALLAPPAGGPAGGAAGGRQEAAPPPAPHPLPGHPGVRSTHDAAAYRRMVQAGIEFVRAGDVFQVNLAQQFHLPAAVDPVELHLRARRVNPAPFAASFAAGGVHVVSMSPERFLQVGQGTVRMHPIKGTRRVIASPEADLFAGDELTASDKDRAENVMIVDLVRNDLARVCTPASVRVEALCRLERYRYVQHLVSVVAGRLRPGLGALDALAAALPGGSVTGAPKHRACEIISTLEGVARGAYCGALGYVGCDGSADFNLLIRTFVIGPDAVAFAAGGGVTAASDPAAEHAESLAKAEGMLRALAALASGGDGR